jgi:1-hydroxycarotenoid 3,4-desaturase
MADRVIVVGAGVGGLVAALELASRGCDVTLLERAAGPGGKMSETELAGRHLDAGPTVFTMRWVFDELFAAIGERLDDHLVLQPLQVLARHAWSADERLDLFADLERSCDAIGRFAGAREANAYRAFCARSQAVYESLEAPFLRRSRPSLPALLLRAGWRGLPGLMRISPFASLWDTLGRCFTDPRLRQLFGRYATYCGASPFLAPATLMLVAHVERAGVWSVAGGMHRVAQVLADGARRRGARLRWDAPVRRILVEGGRAVGVELDGGEQLAADAVVFNGDAAALGDGLLGEHTRRAVPPRRADRRSQSALTWGLVAQARGFPLLRHTVFFGADYADEFDAVFERGELPRDPTVYVCAQDRGDPADAVPTGEERLLCLVNAPARADHRPLTPQEIARCEQQSFQRLARCGLDLTPVARCTTTPDDFAKRFPATGGALYGMASHGWRASFTRPTQDTAIPGLWLAGGSTHPGPGVPMAALSGRLAAAGVLQDLSKRPVSMHRSTPAVMPGGTSTRSATTADTA